MRIELIARGALGALLIVAGCGGDVAVSVPPVAASEAAGGLRVFVVRSDDVQPVAGAELFCVRRGFDLATGSTAEAERAALQLAIDPLGYGRRHGARVVADAEGVAMVPADTAWLTGRADGLFGSRRIRAAGSQWTTLTLDTDESFRVRVIDADGCGVSGIHVAIRHTDEETGAVTFTRVGQSRGRSGELTVAHVQKLRDARWARHRALDELCAFEPGLHDAEGTPVDLLAVPSSVVELRLPPAGVIEVVASWWRAGGEPWDVQIEETGGPPPARSFHSRGVTGDRWRWSHVGLGREFVVVASDPRHGVIRRAAVVGPCRQGRVVVVRIGDDD